MTIEPIQKVMDLAILRQHLKVLRQSQDRGAHFDICTWDHQPRTPIFREFISALMAHDWLTESYRWDVVEDPHEYWAPETVVKREPSYTEALQCARYVHRCERLSHGSPWPQALAEGVVDWIMAGLLIGNKEAVQCP